MAGRVPSLRMLSAISRTRLIRLMSAQPGVGLPAESADRRAKEGKPLQRSSFFFESHSIMVMAVVGHMGRQRVVYYDINH